MRRIPRPAPWLGLLVGLVLLTAVAALVAHLGGAGDSQDAGLAAERTVTTPPDPAALRAAARRRAMAQIALWRQPVYRGAPTSRLVGLSFDDGPAPSTMKVLAALNRLHVNATFFVIGRQVRGNERELRAILAHGNEIAVHTWDHPDLTTLTNARARGQVIATRDAIREATGVDPGLYRPPYGAIDDRVARAIGPTRMVPVLWDTDGDDWNGLTAAQISRRVLAEAHPGAIILLHDGGGMRGPTVAAIPAIVRGLRARGLTPVPVGRLLETDPPARDGAPAATVDPDADPVAPPATTPARSG